MKIVKLVAENIKKVRAVEITPDGNTVIISGRNEQGKTSVLDAIWYALGGRDAMKGVKKPIRDGETSAKVVLDLGDYRVERTFSGDATNLKVTSADGKAKFSSPQDLLNGLIGNLAFDPLAFSNMKEPAQKEMLMGLVDIGIDLTMWEANRKALYDDRTAINRTAKELEGQLSGLPLQANVPAKEVIISDILAEKADAEKSDAKKHEAVNYHQEKLRLFASNEQRSATMLSELSELEAKAEAVKKEREILLCSQAEISKQIDQEKKVMAALEFTDMAKFDTQIIEAEETNKKVRMNLKRIEVADALKAKNAESDSLTIKIKDMDDSKTKAITSAVFPIDGLSFDDVGVVYKGMPFAQCSSAERLRVSLAMAMAMNPKLRVIRIMDGSLLDSNNMAVIKEMAEKADFQVWIECVDESGKVGIVIEDGSVVDQAEA